MKTMQVVLAAAVGFAFQETPPDKPAPGKPVTLPGKMIEHRFFLHPVAVDGSVVTFVTDTGGGLFISSKAADRLKLARQKISADGRDMDAVPFPEFKPGASIPPPIMDRGVCLPVLPDSEVEQLGEGIEGLLGQVWFRDRVWTFDYKNGQLLLRAPGDVPQHEPEHKAVLGFRVAGAGRRTSNHPRITIKVDGESLDVLFDTGATSHLSDAGVKALGDGRASQRASSFINRTTMDQWRKNHPDWLVIEKADRLGGGQDMIEVPKIEVAGFEVGPVWFAARPDKAYVWMSGMMDKRIVGALGGSGLKYFRITVDYPAAVAVFEKID